LCDKEYHYIEHNSNEDLKHIPVENQHYLSSVNRGNASAMIKYNDYIRIGQSTLDSITKTKCNRIDTSKLHAVKTNIDKKISSWRCKKYIIRKENDTLLILWITKDIPSYINPGIFALNIDGGIAQVEFPNGNKISLTSIISVADKPNILPCSQFSSELYDITEHQISKW
jgi:hypothetical protein